MNPWTKELPPPEPEAMENEHEKRAEQAAAEAAERVKRGQAWLDWLAIGEGLVIGRLKAMRRAGTNQPIGSTYNRAFGEWMDAHKWAREIDSATRNRAMWAADNKDEIARWRETLAKNVRDAMNHPMVVKRRYDAEHAVKKDAPKKESAKEKYEAEIVRLEEENQKLRKQADRDGSLFDLKQDTAAMIARVIVQNVGPSKLAALVKELDTESKRLKAIRKQAG